MIENVGIRKYVFRGAEIKLRSCRWDKTEKQIEEIQGKAQLKNGFSKVFSSFEKNVKNEHNYDQVKTEI